MEHSQISRDREVTGQNKIKPTKHQQVLIQGTQPYTFVLSLKHITV